MSRLIHANFVRMVKGRIFWMIEFFQIAYSVFAYAMIAGAIKRNGAFFGAWTAYFFHEMLSIGAVLAVLQLFSLVWNIVTELCGIR